MRNFECDECEQLFDEKWKLTAHKKNHKTHKCDVCSKTFQDLDIMKKHSKISHENVRLYCHYFNNDKDCPYAEECIFLHEDSELCRFGKICDRINCMFKHNIVNEEYSDEKREKDKCDNDKHEKDGNNEDEKNDNVVEVELVSETLEFTVYLLCRDYSSRKIEENLTKDLNNCAEVEKVEEVVVHSKPAIGVHLKTTVRFTTQFSIKFKSDERFRKNFWKRFTIRETCPE